MKKQLFLLAAILAMASSTPAWAYAFSAVAPSGQKLYYNIVSGSAQVTYQDYSAPSYSNLTGALTIPSSVTYNGTTYTVTSIGFYAFRYCTNLTSVTIPNSVTSIGEYAFYYCTGLTSVTIPNSVTSIGEYAFYYCTGLTSVTIPNSVTLIGHSAFRYCTGLTSVTIGNSVTTIGSSAFSDCSGLTSVTIPNSVTLIRDSVFSGCSSLTSVTIGSGVTSIGEYAFRGCTGLTSVAIGSGVTSIGSSAFYNCTGLTSTIYTGTIAQWCGISFSESTSNPLYYSHKLIIGGSEITNLVIPNGVTEVKKYAFYNCTGLTSVIIPNSVTSIGYSAFSNVRHIEYYGSASGSPWGAISMNGVTEGDFVYSDATKRNLIGYVGNGGNVIIPSNVETIGNKTFYGCTSLTSVTIGSSVTSIGSGAFMGCSGLTSVTIPNSVTSIGNYTFYDCTGLTSVTIPNSVTSIGSSAFYNCIGLTEMWMKPATPPTLGNVSSLCDRIIDLVVPHNAYTTYTNADTNYTRHRIHNDTIFVVGNANDTSRGRVICDYDFVYPYPSVPPNTITLTAIANYGYHFTRWSDNTTENIHFLTGITQDTVMTAYFDPNQYTITLSADSTIHGTVSGGGSYNYLSNRTITATPSYGHHFTYWNDGVTDNPRTITLTQDTSFTAHFAPNQYTLTVNAGEHGTATGSGTYTFGDTITIQAFPEEHYHFTRWNDGSRENPRQYRVVENKTLTAFFAIDTHTVRVVSNDIVRGMVEASGTEFVYGTPCTVTATAYTGYTFAGWSNGVTATPYTFAVISDVELTALFVEEGEQVYTVSVLSADQTMGTVSGGGQALYGGTLTISATPRNDYRFLSWNDGNTDNPRTVTVTGNVTYTAYFESLHGITDVDATDITIYVSDGRIVARGAEGMEMRLFDVMGREVMHPTHNGETPVMPAGVYLVKVGNYPARKVVVIR